MKKADACLLEYFGDPFVVKEFKSADNVLNAHQSLWKASFGPSLLAEDNIVDFVGKVVSKATCVATIMKVYVASYGGALHCCCVMNDVKIMGSWLILVSCAVAAWAPPCGARRETQMHCGQSQEQIASRENAKAPIFVLPVMFIGVQDAAFAQQQANPCQKRTKDTRSLGLRG